VISCNQKSCASRAAAAPDAADADSGAGAEESGSKAAEETPIGNVEEQTSGEDVDWQLGAPSVGDGGDDAVTGTPEGDEAAEDGGSAVEAEPEVDIGGGAEGDSAQVRVRRRDRVRVRVGLRLGLAFWLSQYQHGCVGSPRHGGHGSSVVAS